MTIPVSASSPKTDICSPHDCYRDNPRKALLTTVKEAVDNVIRAAIVSDCVFVKGVSLFL
jgi:hypothetical protein